MHTVKIYLKGWADFNAYRDANRDPNHPRHADAVATRAVAWEPYEIGQACYHAVTYTADDGLADAAICNQAFDRFNVGDRWEDDVVRVYRDAGHRSLSVGDVVIVDGRAYTVASCGWELVANFTDSSAE